MKFFDITKSITLLAAVAFLWFHGGKFVSSFNNSFVQPAVLNTIDDNALKLSNLVVNDKAVKDLRKDFKVENSKILNDFEEQKKYTKEVLEELGKVSASQKQTRDLINRKSDKIATPKKKVLAYEFKKVYAKDTDGKQFPVAWVMYHPNQSEDKRWKTGTYPLEYHTKVIETENKDGSFNRYAEMHLENNQMEETKGIQYPVKLKNIEWAKVEEKECSWMLNPRLSMGGVVTTESIYPGLGLSFFSYGKTTRDMDWKFLSVGIGGNADTLFCFFEPVAWNFGNVIPLIENAFAGPIVDVNIGGGIGYGMGLSIPF